MNGILIYVSTEFFAWKDSKGDEIFKKLQDNIA